MKWFAAIAVAIHARKVFMDCQIGTHHLGFRWT